MTAATLVPADILALSFVRDLPARELYPLLRGEPIGLQAEPSLPFDDAAPPPARAPLDSLEQVLEALSFGPRAPAAIAQARREAESAAHKARNHGMDVLTLGDDRYPPLLARIFDPPLVLWVRGSIDALRATSVAIVGSRAASSYGEQTAERLASELASCGLVVASGLARGVDGAAHRGAVAGGGRTVAVLGCGADVVYPPEHKQLVDDILRHGGSVISEHPPGTPPYKRNFPRRNRVISGLSLGVVVVEAWQRSGALITANCALDQNREVMAVPGSVLGERHRGSHMLLKCGAALVECAGDVLEALKLAKTTEMQAGSPDGADPLLSTMDAGEPLDLDSLAAATGWDVAALLPRLLQLELAGVVCRAPGGRFVRSGRNVVRS